MHVITVIRSEGRAGAALGRHTFRGSAEIFPVKRLSILGVDEEIRQGMLHEVKVKEMDVDRKIRLVYPARRVLSHAAQAFLEVVGG